MGRSLLNAGFAFGLLLILLGFAPEIGAAIHKFNLFWRDRYYAPFHWAPVGPPNLWLVCAGIAVIVLSLAAFAAKLTAGR